MNPRLALATVVFLTACSPARIQKDIDLNNHDILVREGESELVTGGVVLSYWSLEKLKKKNYKKWAEYMIGMLNHESFKVREQASFKLRHEPFAYWSPFIPEYITAEQKVRIQKIKNAQDPFSFYAEKNHPLPVIP